MDDQQEVKSRFGELREELQIIFAGRIRWVDSLVPPLVFIFLDSVFGFDVALWGALGIAILFVGIRLLRRQPLGYAFGGLGGVLVAVIVARFVGSAEGYFLPGIVMGAIYSILCLVSLIARRPLLAWISYIARRWPLDWYWHPRVRPAYNEVTLIWAVFLISRSLLQYALFQDQEAAALGLIQMITGWPATILLMALSYLYGVWRLKDLGGPSIEEFKAGSEPPWEGQKRGF